MPGRGFGHPRAHWSLTSLAQFLVKEGAGFPDHPHRVSPLPASSNRLGPGAYCSGCAAAGNDHSDLHARGRVREVKRVLLTISFDTCARARLLPRLTPFYLGQVRTRRRQGSQGSNRSWRPAVHGASKRAPWSLPAREKLTCNACLCASTDCWPRHHGARLFGSDDQIFRRC